MYNVQLGIIFPFTDQQAGR